MNPISRARYSEDPAGPRWIFRDRSTCPRWVGPGNPGVGAACFCHSHLARRRPRIRLPGHENQRHAARRRCRHQNFFQTACFIKPRLQSRASPFPSWLKLYGVAPADFPAAEARVAPHTRIGKLGEEVPDGAPIIGEWRDFTAYAIYSPARSPSGGARKVTQIPGSTRSLCRCLFDFPNPILFSFEARERLASAPFDFGARMSHVRHGGSPFPGVPEPRRSGPCGHRRIPSSIWWLRRLGFSLMASRKHFTASSLEPSGTSP